jgi:phospholipid/cholesterol/gamma-HCH transport system substrate-binding protein
VKRVAAFVAFFVALALGVFVVVRGGDADAYTVRAIFDNAGFLVPGEDVKVAGVKVGKVQSLDVTPDFKAAVVMRIDDPGYQDFRRDASCIIRPQSLIGEKFVECEPTQKRAVGTEPPPPLRKLDQGPGAGQYFLPVQNTEQSVDLDLINNTLRLPYRERLSLIINELGATVAGRGEDVRAVIRRANPALKEIDRVLAILASQNKALQDLATNGDTILAPLARERRHISGALASSAEVAQATAERRADFQQDIQKFPEFLRELRPTMTRLGALSDEMTPVLADLHDAAPDINRMIIQLGPFSQAALPAVDSLGETAKVGTPAITAARPVIRDLRDLGKAAKPVALTARQLLESFQKTQGIERAMDYIFYQVAARRPDRQHLLDLLDPADRGLLGELRAGRRVRLRGHGATARPGADAHRRRAARGARGIQEAQDDDRSRAPRAAHAPVRAGAVAAARPGAQARAEQR